MEGKGAAESAGQAGQVWGCQLPPDSRLHGALEQHRSPGAQRSKAAWGCPCGWRNGEPSLLLGTCAGRACLLHSHAKQPRLLSRCHPTPPDTEAHICQARKASAWDDDSTSLQELPRMALLLSCSRSQQVKAVTCLLLWGTAPRLVCQQEPLFGGVDAWLCLHPARKTSESRASLPVLLKVHPS